MEIYVIRHTQVAVSKDICYGQSNVLLADTFQEEVNSIKTKLPSKFDSIYSSPINRCTQMAEALELGTIKYEKQLMELNFGDWEGKLWNDLDQESLTLWMRNFVTTPPPNGESLSLLYERVNYFLDTLRKENYNKVLLVTHAGVIRCIWAYLLAIPLENIFKLPVGYQEVFVFSLNKDPNWDKIISSK